MREKKIEESCLKSTCRSRCVYALLGLENHERFYSYFSPTLASSVSKVIFNDVLKITLLHLTASANNLISHFSYGAYALFSHFSHFHCIAGVAFINPEQAQWIG